MQCFTKMTNDIITTTAKKPTLITVLGRTNTQQPTQMNVMIFFSFSSAEHKRWDELVVGYCIVDQRFYLRTRIFEMNNVNL